MPKSNGKSISITPTISLKQPIDGPFVDESATFLAHFFLQWGTGTNILEIGTGNGVISILIALRQPQTTITAYEIQPHLATLASENSVIARCSNIDVVANDIHSLSSTEMFDHIVSNPPFYPVDQFRASPKQSLRWAHTEEKLTLEDVLHICTTHLTQQGSAFLMYPVFRLPAILQLSQKFSLHLRRMQFMHFSASSNAQKVLLQLGKTPSDWQILPPLWMRETAQTLKKEWWND